MAAVPLLAVRNLAVELRREGERRRLLEEVSFELGSRRVLGVLGESGSGKTVLAKALVGWVSPPLHVAGGEVRHNGTDILRLHGEARRKMRGTVGYIGADPGSAFDPTIPVGRQIAEKLLAVRPETDPATARGRVVELLDAVRIPSAARRFDEFPFQYSGGMLQRAMIVDALVTEPALLICDNIVQPLDVTVAAQILRLLHELRERLDAGILFIATSLPVLADIADEVLVLSRGRIVEAGGAPRALATAAKHPVTIDIIARNPPIWTDEVPFRAPPPVGGTAMLAVEEVTKTYTVPDRSRFFGTQAVQAVRGVSFDVWPGDNFGLVGESGCGKSTLSRLLSWIEAPDQGRILFEGQDIARMDGKARLAMRRRFQLLLQDPFNCLPPHLPVGRTIAESLKIHGVGQRERKSRVESVMAEVGLAPADADRLPVGMSAGQRQRVNIARALVLEPRLMILDETLSALDPVEQGRLLDLFERLQARHGLTYLFISHDLAMVRRVCSRIAVMYLGKVVELADTETIFMSPGHPYTRALLSAVPTLEEKPYRTSECLLEGEPPSPIDLPPGCSFAARCPHAFLHCRNAEPGLHARGPGRLAACHLVDGGGTARHAA